MIRNLIEILKKFGFGSVGFPRKSKLTGPNPKFFNISMRFRARFDRTEPIKIIQMYQIYHIKLFKFKKTSKY